MVSLKNVLAAAAMVFVGTFTANAALTFEMNDEGYNVATGGPNTPKEINGFEEIQWKAGLTIDGLVVLTDEEDKFSGTWEWDNFEVSYLGIKSSNEFWIVDFSDNPISAGDWCTNDTCYGLPGIANSRGKWQDLSHLSFYGSFTNAVPEPATWLMMIMGFGLVGLASRRRSAALTA